VAFTCEWDTTRRAPLRPPPPHSSRRGLHRLLHTQKHAGWRRTSAPPPKSGGVLCDGEAHRAGERCPPRRRGSPRGRVAASAKGQEAPFLLTPCAAASTLAACSAALRQAPLGGETGKG
jgi:hypothetical protein